MKCLYLRVLLEILLYPLKILIGILIFIANIMVDLCYNCDCDPISDVESNHDLIGEIIEYYKYLCSEKTKVPHNVTQINSEERIICQTTSPASPVDS
jgi:hypothetical protein